MTETLTRTTAERAIRIRQNNPCMTLQQIASHIGVSRERVRQVLKRGQVSTKAIHPKNHLICNNCGKLFIKKRHHSILFCCARCKYEFNNPLVKCENCGCLFRKRISCIRRGFTNPRYRGKFFCNRKCFWVYIAKNYGFGVHPENIGINYTKYSKEICIKIVTEKMKGESLWNIAKTLGVPTGTIYTLYPKILKGEIHYRD